MIRVLHIVGKMDMAGLETMIMNYYRYIDRSQVVFDFIPLSGKQGFYDDEIRNLGGTILYPPFPYDWKKPHLFATWFESVVDHGNYSVVHSHNGGAASIVFPLSKKYGIKTILHSHNTGNRKERHIKEVLRRFVLIKNFKYVDLFVACSDEAGYYMFGDRNFRVISNAINVSSFCFDLALRKSIRNKLAISDKEFVIGTVGRLTEQKNPIFIIDLINALVEKGFNFKFLWIGDGELKDYIKQELIKRDISNYVLMPGTTPAVNEYYQAMDLFVLPSLFEGLGIVAIEAQAAGLRTMCSINVPKMAAVTDNCLFLDIDNYDYWIEKISAFINNPVERKDYSITIRQAGFDIESEAEKLLELYRNLLFG